MCVCVCVCELSCSVMSNSLGPHEPSPPSSSVHGIFQTRILEWIVISFSISFLPYPGIELESPALAGKFCATVPPGKPLYIAL